ncbi:family 16 glycosylhydrolase [Aquabacterium sp.]|uniref:family 16 glycosylhydrolase n=1 Tax=Aquabacterium sp. TaxID=1872578 RepID=UPI0025B924F5|nr:family 16 glycosylhydrolase [Aquabacterium sp.]
MKLFKCVNPTYLFKILTLASLVLIVGVDAALADPANLSNRNCSQYSSTIFEFDGICWVKQDDPALHTLSEKNSNQVQIDKNGTLKLVISRNKANGQRWLSGSLRSVDKFLYGRFEASYKYVPGEGVNNAFWLMDNNLETGERWCEIDVNEGHYPNEISMNIHNWSGQHTEDSMVYYTGEPDGGRGVQRSYRNIDAGGLTVDEIVLRQRSMSPFRVADIKLFQNSSVSDVPIEVCRTTDSISGPVCFKSVTASSSLKDRLPEYAIDNVLTTQWTAVGGQEVKSHYIKLKLNHPTQISAVSILEGWVDAYKNVRGAYGKYSVEFYKYGGLLRTVGPSPADRNNVNLSAGFNNYAVDWSSESIKYYFNGVLIRESKNIFCHKPMYVYLSSAVVDWAGEVSDEIKDTAMMVRGVNFAPEKIIGRGDAVK